jgi:2-desacetyl-2-hydroxyethyl bacteriochlorophyllide A dehydrogenase
LDLARQLGADLVINAAEEDLVARMLELTGSAYVQYNTKPTAHVDVVIDCAGLEVTAQQALRVVKPVTGRVVLVALYEDTPVKIDLNDAVTKTNDIRGVYGAKQEDNLTALELIASGKLDQKSLITHRFPLEQAKEAFETQLNTAECLKVMIVPSLLYS